MHGIVMNDDGLWPLKDRIQSRPVLYAWQPSNTIPTRFLTFSSWFFISISSPTQLQVFLMQRQEVGSEPLIAESYAGTRELESLKDVT